MIFRGPVGAPMQFKQLFLSVITLGILLAFSIVQASQSALVTPSPTFTLVSEERIAMYQNQISPTLRRLNWARRGISVVAAASFAITTTLFLHQASQWLGFGGLSLLNAFFPSPAATQPAVSINIGSSSSSSSSLTSNKPGESSGLSLVQQPQRSWADFGKGVAYVAAQGLVGGIISQNILPYAQLQTLAWYLEQKDPYFFSIYSLQLSAQNLERASFSDSFAVSEIIRAVNFLIDNTEHIIAYMYYSATSFDKDKQAQVREIGASIKIKTDIFVKEVETLLKKRSTSNLTKVISTLRQEMLVLFGRFACLEGSIIEWQKYVYSLTDTGLPSFSSDDDFNNKFISGRQRHNYAEWDY